MFDSRSNNQRKEVVMKRSVWMLGVAFIMAAPAMAEERAAVAAPRLVDLSQAPLSPSQLTDGKKEDAAVLLLRAAQREKVSASRLDALVARQKARDAALMEVIGPDSPATRAVAKALAEKLGGFLSEQAVPGHAEAVALQMVQSIFLNRRDDLASIQSLYDDEEWRQAIRARLEKGDIPGLNVKLSDAKRAELQNTALYVHTPGNPDGKIEPAVHLLLTALAQQIGHAALAEVTRAGSPAHARLQESIASALPGDPAAKEWLNDWLMLREGRAAAVAEDFRPDGALMQDAVAQSETKRRARLKSPPPVVYKP